MNETAKPADSIVERMRASSDVMEKLQIAGLIREPFHGGPTKQECGNCIYYLPNHQFCNLPELMIPVEPDWWCRLWRV